MMLGNPGLQASFVFSSYCTHETKYASMPTSLSYLRGTTNSVGIPLSVLEKDACVAKKNA